jgi:toxin ParE1/3/4
MSGRSRSIDFTSRAQRDLRQIRYYTLEHWSEAQAVSYIKELSDTFELLLDNPELGKRRDDVRPGVRILRAKKHRILYRMLPDSILIVRIIHGRQDERRIAID